MEKKYCDEAGKFCYTSKTDARRALVGHLAQKSMRVYQCPHNKGHYHVTRMWKRKYDKKHKTGERIAGDPNAADVRGVG
jgi:hypothetical protein